MLLSQMHFRSLIFAHRDHNVLIESIEFIDSRIIHYIELYLIRQVVTLYIMTVFQSNENHLFERFNLQQLVRDLRNC